MIIEPNPYSFVTDEHGLPSFSEGEVQIFIPRYNSLSKRADASGAFHPGALAFSKVHGLNNSCIHKINNRKSKTGMRHELLDKMEEVASGVSVWAFFNHGYMHGMQYGLRSPGHPLATSAEIEDFDRFCKIISSGHTAPLSILYACSTGDDPDDDPDTAPGSGDGCFSDLLRDGICANHDIYCGVWAHTTAGHSFFNPNVKYFFGTGSVDGGIGGEMLFAPGTPEFKRFTRELPTSPDALGPFWTRFPFIPLKNLRSRYSPLDEDS